MNEMLESLRNPWILLGFAGQAVFSLRFLVQWIESERAGRSVVPDSFWYLSIAGSMLLLGYALWRRDVVFTLGQSMGFVVYARNLALRRRDTA
ncbi:MAG TPA: lipid-A-disaccharide synthase N-terminal domain-containing protein [Myxococcota bacterium]|nr:lipid-A-disaccharide synthase N-terminal domain-containing protein [Myxococcota bacterium]